MRLVMAQESSVFLTRISCSPRLLELFPQLWFIPTWEVSRLTFTGGFSSQCSAFLLSESSLEPLLCRERHPASATRRRRWFYPRMALRAIGAILLARLPACKIATSRLLSAAEKLRQNE